MPEPSDEAVPAAESEERAAPGMLFVEELFGRAGDREKVAEALAWFSEGRFASALVFAVRGDKAVAWRGFGPKIVEAALPQMWLPLDRGSILREAIDGRRLVLCGTPGHDLDRRLLAWAGLPIRSPVLATVVVAKDRVVTALWASSGARAMRERIDDEAGRATTSAARAYERMLLARKSIDD